MIPFNKPVWLGSEIQRISEAIQVHGHVAGEGPFGKRCETLLERQLGQPALLVSSCTHALEMAALLLGVGPGDEVILPSFTFVSTANAFVLRGASLVFADVDHDGNLAPAEVEAVLGPRTRAVVPVHYAGNSCDMGRLLEVCSPVPVVEDAAQALGASCSGRPLGTFGQMGTFSFHETKNVGCGEGGALTVRDPALLERAHYLRDKGTNRQRFLSGLVDKYSWVDVGSSYVLSDLNAAYLLDQLEAQPRITARRKAIFDAYQAALAGPVERAGGYLVGTQPRNLPNYHLFGIVFRRPEERAAFIAHMRSHGIVTPFHYVALHLSHMGQKHGAVRRPLPHTERLSACLVRLPMFFNMTDGQLDEVVARAREFIDGL